MTDREERQRVIEILQKERKTALHDNKWAFDYAISSIEIDLKYDLLYEETSGQADKPTTKNNLVVDAISRQAINGYIDYILSHGMGKQKSFEFIKKFVANLPPATPQEPKSEWEHDHEILRAYSDGANEVLDIIRAEIESKCCITVGRENDGAITLHDVFEIIDKYKAESEA